MNSKARLWTQNFILCSAINFQLVLIFYLLVVVIVGYAVSELAASTAQAGLVSGLFIVGTLIGRLLVGKFLTKFGRKTTLIVGLIGFLIFSILYFIHLGIGFLLFVRCFHGFMMGMASTVLGTIIAQILPPSRRGEGIGYYSMSSTLGTAIGPFLGIWLMFNVGYEAIFSISTAIAISCLITSFFLKVPEFITSQQDKHPQPDIVKTDWIAQFIEPKALPIAIVIFIASICYSGVLSFVHFYAKSLDLVGAATFFFLMYSLAILVSRPFTGRLLDKKGENIIMYPALIILAASLFLLSQVHNAGMLLLCAALLGFGFGNIQSVCQTIAVKSTSVERMGLATSTFFIFLDAGLGFGPFFIGKLLDYMSYSHLYFYSGFIAILCIVLYFTLHGKNASQKRKIVNI
ncbi:MFS transporter [Acinetobacter stercoris]|uniref:Major facilitator superfamily transporter n=1 Tax=Acinetobacter stercoris TaxID=2126983 RepID=A0A2U3MYY8_9GAMM|nr:MFS transporter [Acinetobacter stercoris]SPL70640.1 major facilitator superfamily transporter [Acinetobacter stercoris]